MKTQVELPYVNPFREIIEYVFLEMKIHTSFPPDYNGAMTHFLKCVASVSDAAPWV